MVFIFIRKKNLKNRRNNLTVKKWAWGKSVERWEKTWYMWLEASHHEAQKCRITVAPLWHTLSSSSFDFNSFTDPPPPITSLFYFFTASSQTYTHTPRYDCTFFIYAFQLSESTRYPFPKPGPRGHLLM